jgi:hypothetical protein
VAEVDVPVSQTLCLLYKFGADEIGLRPSLCCIFMNSWFAKHRCEKVHAMYGATFTIFPSRATFLVTRDNFKAHQRYLEEKLLSILFSIEIALLNKMILQESVVLNN